MMGRICCETPFVVYVEHFQYIEQKCSIILFGDRLDEAVMQSLISFLPVVEILSYQTNIQKRTRT